MEIGGAVFYNNGFNLAAMDAHSLNVLVAENGAIIPIDVVIGTPGPDLTARFQKEFPPPGQSGISFLTRA